MRKTVLFILLVNCLLFSANGQINVSLEKQAAILRVTSIEEFIERFNLQNIEALKSIIQTNNDKDVSKQEILITLCNWDDSANHNLYKEFIIDISFEHNNRKLDFYRKDWFARAECEFYYKGRNIVIPIIFENSISKDFSEWKISKIETDIFNIPYTIDPTKFLRPFSHVNYFLDLNEAFANDKYLINYIAGKSEIDPITIFLYEIRKKELVFKKIRRINYVFNNVGRWQITVAHFNRTTRNSGWLISDLKKYRKP